MLAQALVSQGVLLVPTWTTRPLRKGEAGRGDIVQVTLEAMQSDMLEAAEYDGSWYGTPLNAEVRAALARERVAVKILEAQGLAIVRHK